MAKNDDHATRLAKLNQRRRIRAKFGAKPDPGLEAEREELELAGVGRSARKLAAHTAKRFFEPARTAARFSESSRRSGSVLLGAIG